VGSRAPLRCGGRACGRGRAAIGGSKLTVQTYLYVPDATRAHVLGGASRAPAGRLRHDHDRSGEHGNGAGRPYSRGMRPRARRALRWAAAILGAVVVLGVAFVTTLAVQMSGGWDDVLDLSKPLPGDPEVVAAREAGGARLDAETARVVDGVVLPNLTDGRVAQPALTGAAALATDPGLGLGSGCEVGSHDWKRDDPYDLYCVEVRRTVLAGSEGAFATDMPALHAALLADGWTPREPGSELPARLARAREEGGDRPGPAAYRSEDGQFTLLVSFELFESYTGRPAPTLGQDEHAVMVSIDLESFRD
jgi:hypothetical protein